MRTQVCLEVAEGEHGLPCWSTDLSSDPAKEVLQHVKENLKLTGKPTQINWLSEQSHAHSVDVNCDLQYLIVTFIDRYSF